MRQMLADAAGHIADRIFCVLTSGVRPRAWVPAAVLLALVWGGPGERSEPATAVARAADWPELPPGELLKLQADNRRLKSALDKLSPSGVHIVVDTARNRLYLKNGGKVVLEAVCSTGNGKILRDAERNREWEFQTPRGEFRVLKKVHRPVWTKPDWAFVEEGEEIPKSFKERIEEDMLGDYALHIGNSYLIHGTLYRRLLGRSVTHGCIRLGDEDLEKVYKTASVGTRVFIY